MTTGVTTGPYRVDQGNTEWFGDADYKKILADAASNNQDLQAVRNGVLEWLESDDGRSKYRGNNDGSDPYGRNTFYDRIKWPTINAAFGNYAGGSEEKDYFGDADLYAARAAGFSDADIADWIQANPHKVRDANKPISEGGSTSGIYTVLVGEEASRNYGQVTTGPVEGQGGGGFGHADYSKLLIDQWTRTENTADLKQVRIDALAYINEWKDDPTKIWPTNKPGYRDENGDVSPTNLYSMINDHARNPRDGGSDGQNWNRDQIDIGAMWGGDHGEDNKTFTRADYLAAKASGHTDYDVYRYLRDNKDQWVTTAGRVVYDQIRDKLIQRGNMFGNLSGRVDDTTPTGTFSWRKTLENPLVYEVGEYMSATMREHRNRHWGSKNDYERLLSYIGDAWGPIGGNIENYKTEDDLAAIIGNYGDNAGQSDDAPPLNWESGEYWSHWGVNGPPERDQGDGLNKGDLTWVQKMVAQAGLEAEDPSEWKSNLEYLENRFLEEMYTWPTERESSGNINRTGEEPGFMHPDSDEFGLDIMRKGLSFDNVDVTDDTWYYTLTRGDIDWAFYKDSKAYQKAREVLGMDSRIDTVQEIRQANVWIHGQETVFASDGPEWIKYNAKFKYETDPATGERYPVEATPGVKDADGNPVWRRVAEFEASELQITGYSPESKRGLASNIEPPDAPTINIPDTEITRPSNLDESLTIRD